VAQQDGGQILQPGERELGHHLERRVLDGELLEAWKAAEGELLDPRDVVTVQRELLQRPQAGERVRLDDRKVVLGQRQVLDRRRQLAQGDLLEATRVTQHLGAEKRVSLESGAYTGL